jgi:hypothetical protein
MSDPVLLEYAELPNNQRAVVGHGTMFMCKGIQFGVIAKDAHALKKIFALLPDITTEFDETKVLPVAIITEKLFKELQTSIIDDGLGE